jgi:hypothetical protein
MNRRWVFAAGLVALVLALGAAAVAIARKPNLVDDAPSKEEAIRQARDRGIEGTISVPDRASVDEDAEPFRYGPFLLIPYGWEGPEKDEYEPTDNPTPRGPAALTTEEARKSPLWREPNYIPPEYEFDRADSEDINRHVRLLYKSSRDFLEIQVWYPLAFPLIAWFSPTDDGEVVEPVEIDGMPALLWHDPTGETGLGISLYAYEKEKNIAYVIQAGDSIDAAEVSRILSGLR